MQIRDLDLRFFIVVDPSPAYPVPTGEKCGFGVLSEPEAITTAKNLKIDANFNLPSPITRNCKSGPGGRGVGAGDHVRLPRYRRDPELDRLKRKRPFIEQLR